MRRRALVTTLTLLGACNGDPPPPSGTAPTATATAEPVRPPIDTSKLAPLPAGAPPPREQVALGRLLFFDDRLAGTNDMSCATCHKPDVGFGDGLPKGHGHQGKELARNTPTVLSMNPAGPFFWDGRARTLEEQAMMPIASGDEMAQDPVELIAELSVVPEYVARFQAAFGGRVTTDGISNALAAFERTLVSRDAPIDRYLKGDEAALDARATEGLKLFVGKARCIKCHEGPYLTDAGFHNIGVKSDDVGRFAVLDLPAMKGAFKTPGLRDVAQTGPYLHDGSAATLMEVIELYDRGGDVKENLDGDIEPLKLTGVEKAALVAFLEALSGKSPEVGVVEVPGTFNSEPGPLLKEDMLAADGILANIDDALTDLVAGKTAEVNRHLEKVLRHTEGFEAALTPIIPRAKYERFRLLQGQLIVEVKEMRAELRSKSLPELKKRYRVVRDRCEACHAEFRPDE